MNQLNLPKLGLGTYLLTGKDAQKTVEAAYEIGYRHFDTATFYENEEWIGKALKGVKREGFQITTKVWNEDMGYHSALNAFDRSLNKLQIDYVDLYLIHWPDPKGLILETLEAIHSLKEKGRIRHYGVSNFTIRHLRDVKEAGFKVSANQVEYHPYLNQEDLLDYCLNEAIQLIAYSPLARGELSSDPLLGKIGQKYGKTIAQIALRWLLEKDIIAIPKTQQTLRLKENIDLFDFDMTSEEVAQINRLNRGYRITDPDCGDFDY